MSTVVQSTSHVHFTAFDIQSSHFGLNLYDTSLKLEQEQPELWLAENHEIPSNATAVKMLSEEGEEKKKISSKVCGEKKKKTCSLDMKGFKCPKIGQLTVWKSKWT